MEAFFVVRWLKVKDGLDHFDGAYFRKLMETHPGLPPEIFPWEK